MEYTHTHRSKNGAAKTKEAYSNSRRVSKNLEVHEWMNLKQIRDTYGKTGLSRRDIKEEKLAMKKKKEKSPKGQRVDYEGRGLYRRLSLCPGIPFNADHHRESSPFPLLSRRLSSPRLKSR
ncbi:hypothetical protein K0M31_005709 [Melipona bicolor]|uniref:Uncharacterized protein n=1 Tax=Melipona bicolor TaxID=60889 RepID=A0AA40KM56_9HYME|nr:hypothetical protein K0M31_005709 [Melipona bicolor]